MSNKKTGVLVVEDDAAVRNLVSTALDLSGYDYQAVTDATSALASIAEHQPEVILLDLGLPDMDGVDFIRRVRTWSHVAIIVISARTSDEDKISALDAGADDYLTKPFSVGELLARLRAAERHIAYLGEQVTPEAPVFVNGDLRIDYASERVTMEGREVRLTPMEYRLLCLLARNVGRVLTHGTILREVWGGPQKGDLASLRVFMGSLRKKIEANTSEPRYIQTHVGVGYRMIQQ